MSSYKDLLVWQKSIDLIVEIYRVTSSFPSDEKFGLVSQMRRAAVSIPSNVAEGYGRGGRKENAQFVNISFGSALELETQIIVSKRLGLAQVEQWKLADTFLSEIIKMLYSYRHYLQS